MSDVILIEQKIHDHPEGPFQPPQTTPVGPVPSTSDATDPQAEQAPIIHVPDPDPFKEKLDIRIGLVNQTGTTKLSVRGAIGSSSQRN